MARVLIVEDEPDVRRLEEITLRGAGHDVTSFPDAESAEAELSRVAPEVLVLDVSLPGSSGFALCERVRRTSRAPVLFVTGRGSIVDKTRGFGAGGDDYLVKPFSPEELRLRVDALLRRAGPPADQPPVVVGDLHIDPQTRLVRRDGQSLSLSPAELDMLVALASTPGRPWSAERLAQLLRLPAATAVETRGAMRVRMSRLRHRIEPDPERPRYIHHLRGSGYLLDFRPD